MTRFRNGACIDCGSSPCECENRHPDPEYEFGHREAAGDDLAEYERIAKKVDEEWEEALPLEKTAELSKRLVESLKKGNFTLKEGIALDLIGRVIDGKHRLP